MAVSGLTRVTLCVCPDSEAAEGAAGRAQSDPEGAAGERQEAAAGV